MRVEWKSRSSLSAMHAAWCVVTFPRRVQQVGAPLRSAANELDQFSGRLQVDRQPFWNRLIASSADESFSSESPESLVSQFIPADLQPSTLERDEGLHEDLATRIAAVEMAFGAEFPRYDREIRLRQEPLKQLWESHGPGVLRLIGVSTEKNLLVDSAAVYLVQPILGGHGSADALNSRVHMEGVLTNVHPALPETLRLAWLLSQLASQLPVDDEQVSEMAGQQLAGLAMIPPTLSAAEELGLTAVSETIIALAIELWLPEISEQLRPQAAEAIMAWWETYLDARPPWPSALSDLARTLKPVGLAWE